MYKKAIIFDLDNTLWHGVIGENIIEVDYNMINTLKLLASRGVIVGLCSKNNYNDVDSLINNGLDLHSYISIQRIDWTDKATNMKSIIAELNIGADSVVFVDDSEFERNLVHQYLPDVVCIHPDDVMSIVLKHFDLSGNITKTQQYKANLLRERAKVEFVNIEDYLRSLNMVLMLKHNEQNDIARVVELTQKTNQFNLTGTRYSVAEAQDAMKLFNVYTLRVRDKFGDNGLVGVCIVTGTIIDVFLLSCRVLGRNIEFAFIDAVINDMKQRCAVKYLIARYWPTQKNAQVMDFYDRAGFSHWNHTETDSPSHDGSATYSVDVENYKPKNLTYFSYE